MSFTHRRRPVALHVLVLTAAAVVVTLLASTSAPTAAFTVQDSGVPPARGDLVLLENDGATYVIRGVGREGQELFRFESTTPASAVQWASGSDVFLLRGGVPALLDTTTGEETPLTTGVGSGATGFDAEWIDGSPPSFVVAMDGAAATGAVIERREVHRGDSPASAWSVEVAASDLGGCSVVDGISVQLSMARAGRIAVEVHAAGCHFTNTAVHVLDLHTGGLLLSLPLDDAADSAALTPDGTTLSFWASRTGGQTVEVATGDRRADPTRGRLTVFSDQSTSMSVSEDSTRLLHTASGDTSRRDVATPLGKVARLARDDLSGAWYALELDYIETPDGPPSYRSVLRGYRDDGTRTGVAVTSHAPDAFLISSLSVHDGA